MVIATDRTIGSTASVRGRLLAIMQFASAVLLSLTIGCRKPSQMATRGSESPKTPDTHLPGVPNFSKVCDGLYRGGQPTEAGYQALKDMKIRTIVTLRLLGRSSDKLKRGGFRTYHISFKHIHPETEDVLKFLSIATNPDNRPVFVHCREGVDRTGMMVAVYRMVVQDWPKAKAVKEMKRMGFNEWNVPIERYLSNVDVERLKRELARRAANDRPAITHRKRIPS